MLIQVRFGTAVFELVAFLYVCVTAAVSLAHIVGHQQRVSIEVHMLVVYSTLSNISVCAVCCISIAVAWHTERSP